MRGSRLPLGGCMAMAFGLDNSRSALGSAVTPSGEAYGSVIVFETAPALSEVNAKVTSPVPESRNWYSALP